MPARRETEIKLRVRNLGPLIARLYQVGATCHGRVLERNTLFDTPDHDIRRRGRLLRLRVESPARSPLAPAGPARAWLTAKRPVLVSAARYKQNIESEIAVSPRTNWLAAFRSLGFRPGFRYEKFRTSFRIRGLHLDLDETPIGDFLEIEGAPRQIDRIARTLGYSTRDYIRSTYWDLFVADSRRRGKIPRHMLFRP